MPTLHSDSPTDAKRALIVTIGLATDPGGADIVDALMIDVEAWRPERLILASTDRSRPVADALAERARQQGVSVEHAPLNSPHDLDFIFGVVRDAIQRLIDEGFARENIAVNYASGTKVMSCGAVLAAVFNACGSLRYVKTGSTGTPAERLIATPAGGVFANRDLDWAIELATELRFTSACRVLEDIQTDLLGAGDRRLREEALRLFGAYSAWNDFLIGRFLELYETVVFGGRELEPFRLPDDSLGAVRELAAAFASGNVSQPICLELYNSAERCRISDAYNDAVSRLYRAMEVLGQARLLERWSIDADHVDAHRIPPRYRPDFEALRSLQDGRIRLGLRKIYELLYRLEDPLGFDFAADEQMPLRLDERRPAILAHGVEPIDRERCAAFRAWTTAFFERHIEGFQTLRRRLQFPWIVERGA